LRQAHPSATVSQIEAALESTGVPVPDSDGQPYTKPRIRIAQADAALAGGGGGGTSRTVTFQVIKGRRSRGSIIGPGISCTATIGTDCVESYADGSGPLVWYAIPGRRSRFVGWAGDFAPCGSSPGCQIDAIGDDFHGVAVFKRKRRR
jgi:hypothetical protein